MANFLKALGVKLSRNPCEYVRADGEKTTIIHEPVPEEHEDKHGKYDIVKCRVCGKTLHIGQ